MKTFPTASIFRWLNLNTIGLVISSLLISCSAYNRLDVNMALNSLYTDEQPALSGNGRFLAFVSNRNGKRNILLYDLQQKQFVDIPRLNRRDAIAESPSISNNARYIVYIASDSGRPEIELYDRLTNRWQVMTLGYRGWLRNPSISADGRYIIFESGRRGQWDLELIDRGPLIELDIVDGSSPEILGLPSPEVSN